MKNIDFYAFVGIIVPGVLFIFGLSFYFPEISLFLYGKDVGFGDLGLLVILAYGAGHLTQCIGDAIENLWWWLIDGPQTNWARLGKEPFLPVKLMKKLPSCFSRFCERWCEKPFLSEQQRQKLPAKIREVLKIDFPENLPDIGYTDWFYIVRQAYATVKKVGLAGRVDIFNGYWGMMRGMVAGFIILIVIGLLCSNPINWDRIGIFAILVCLGLLRMHRFGIHYARELFVQLLSVLPEDIKRVPVRESVE